MRKRPFSLLIFVICVLLSVSCSAEPPPEPQPTSNIEIIITPQPSTEEPTATTEVEPTVIQEPTEQPTEQAAQEVEPTPTDASSENSIKVGSKEYTEQLLLGKMLILTLQDAGYDVVDKTGFDQAVMRKALEDGEVDMYWELTGTALSTYHGLPPKFTDPETALITVRKLDEANNLVWFDQTYFNNTYTLMVLPSNVERGMARISDLANFMNDNNSPLNVCVEDDFFARDDGLQPLQERYGFEFKPENIQVISYDELYEGLRRGECDVAEGFATDGRITAWDLRNLVDDQKYFPAYNVAPVAHQSILDEHPGLKDKLDNFMSDVGPRLDDNMMGLLNACVDLGPDGEFDTGDEKSVEEVARAFLSDTELDCLPRQIVVGSKEGNDSFIIGKALVLLLEKFGYDVVDNTGLGATSVVREALINKEIDIYWEELNTALTVFQELPIAILDLDSEETLLTLLKKYDAPVGLQWLEPATNIETTYTLMVQATVAEEQNLSTIEDLATFMNANDSPFTLCVEDNFHTRSNGLLGVQDLYGFTFKEENILLVEANQTYQNLQNGYCDVAQGLTTGSSAAYGLQILEDSQDFFKPLIPAPVIRQEILNKSPELIELLGNLTRNLDSDLMAALNYRLQVGTDGIPGSGDEESPETLARFLLCQFDLLSDCPLIIVESQNDNEENGSEETTNSEVTPTPVLAACQEIVVNGTFENEGNWGFGSTASPPSFMNERVHSGEGALRLGIFNQSEDRFSQSVAKQRISIPADAQSATLSYWYNPISADFNDGDVQGALIFAADESFVRRKLMRDLSDQQLWNQQTDDLSAFIGEDVVLYFYVDNDGNGLPSGMYLDDVSVQVCSGSE